VASWLAALNLSALSSPLPPIPRTVLAGLGITVAAAVRGAAAEGASSPATAAAAPTTPTTRGPPPRGQDSVLVLGASGKLGRAVVAAALGAGRSVVAAGRDGDRIRAALASVGLSEGGQGGPGGGPTLAIAAGVDVSDPATLSTPALWARVSQAVIATGPVFGRLPEGGMGYPDGMTPEVVDAKGVAAFAAAAAGALPAPPPPTGPPPTRLAVPLSTPADVAVWEPLDDVIMGGSSASTLKAGEEGEEGAAPPPGGGVVWSGDVVFEGGGFCGARTKRGALGTLDLSSSAGLALSVRCASGQTFKLNIKTAAQEDVPESTYQALLDTDPGGEWRTVLLPWHAFVPTKRARFDPAAPPLDGSGIRSLGLVLSRFEYDGAPNPRCLPGRFELEIRGGIRAFSAPAPAIVLLTSAATERNARLGDDAAARASDVPIVRLNPGGALNWKYVGEAAVRGCGLPYAVLRCTGFRDDLDEDKKEKDTATASEDAAAAPVPARAGAGAAGGGPPKPPPLTPLGPLELRQGDAVSGVLTRADAAAAAVSALASPAATGKTVEVLRGPPLANPGLAPSLAPSLATAWLRVVPDRARPLAGLPPLPAPAPPPPPPSEAEAAEVLADPRVAAAAAAARGGTVRSEEETADLAEAASRPAAPDDGRGAAVGVEGAREALERALGEKEEVGA